MNKIKNTKYLLFFAIVIIFFFVNNNIAYALELKYPVLTAIGLPDINTSPDLPHLVAYFFGILIYVAGFLSLISFVIGAVNMINPSLEAHNDAKDRMVKAVLGLALTLVSYIIIFAINQNSIKLSITPLPQTPGVYLTKSGNNVRQASSTETDLSAISNGLSITYICPTATGATGATASGTGQNILVWLYPQPNLESGNSNFSTITTQELTCGSSVSLNGSGSLKWDYENPGIYFCYDGCSGTMCAHYMLGAKTSSDTNISTVFGTTPVKGIKIVNDLTNNIYYGAIFHGSPGLVNLGTCSKPMMLAPSEVTGCEPVNTATSSVNIFTVNLTDPASSGNGVSFYSEPFGPNSSAGTYSVTPIEIANSTIEQAADSSFYHDDPVSMCFDFNGVNQPDPYKYRCGGTCPNDAANANKCSDTGHDSFANSPGSIGFTGSYVVAVYSQGTDTNGTVGTYCRTFTQKGDSVNLTSGALYPFWDSDAKFTEVDVIPTNPQ